MMSAFTPPGENAWAPLDADVVARLDARFADVAASQRLRGEPAAFVAEGGSKDLARAIMNALDLDHLASWKAFGEVGGGGNCFYAMTNAAAMLIGARPKLDFRLVSGRFSGKDVGSGDIFHAWIEIDDGAEGQVLNLSNLRERPGYLMGRKIYLDLNQCDQILQSVDRQTIRRAMRAAALDIRTGWMKGERVRRLTKKLLAPSFLHVADRHCGEAPDPLQDEDHSPK